MAASTSRAPFSELNTIAPRVRGKDAPSTSVAGRSASSDLKQLLAGVLSLQSASREAATAALKAREEDVGFCQQLIAAIAGACPAKALPTKLSAATYLKNFVKSRWGSKTIVRRATADDDDEAKETSVKMVPTPEERPAIREALLQALLNSTVSELRNMLAECFRMVVADDFPAEWPTLVDTLSAQVSRHLVAGDKENTPCVLENTLMAVHVVTKSYKFLKAADSTDVVPDELMDISRRLVAPVHRMVFGPMAAKLSSEGSKADENDDGVVVNIKHMRIALKSFFCMTRSYMSEHFDAAPWIGSIMQLLKHGVHVAELRSAESSSKGADGDASMGADDDIEDDSGDNAVWRLQKRGVQALLNFQSRHRTYAAYKSIEKEGLALAQRAVKLTNRAAFSDRVRGLFFDFLACGVETTSGWRTLHSSLPTVLAQAVIPSLALTSADRELWQDDEDEFIRRHVEDEGSDALVFHEECVTARRSAMNFVAVLAAREARDAAASKPGAGAGAKKKGRKRGRKRAEAAKSKHLQDCISQLIASVTGTTDEKPSASKRRRSGGDDREGAFALESKHYALLMVVGASSRNLGLKPAMIASLIEDVVLPACVEDFAPEYPVSTIPALQAASMWLLSRVAEHVPARLVMKSFTRSVGLMNVADKETEDDEITWKPVRFSASACVRELIDHKFTRAMLRPHLGKLVDQLAAATAGEDTACLSVLSLAVSKAETDIVPFGATLGSALVARCLEELQTGVDVTESTTIESLVNIVNALSEAMDSDDEDEEDEDEGKAGGVSDTDMAKQVASDVAKLLPELLLKYWQGGESADDAIPFMPDTTHLLAFVMKVHANAAAGAGATAGAGAGSAPGLSASIWSIAKVFARKLPGWWSELSESDDCWDVVMQLAQASIGNDDHVREVFRGVAMLASNWIQHACSSAHVGAFRFLLAVLSSSVNAGVWLDSQTAESVATGMASVFVAGFDKDDMSQRAATIVCCYLLRHATAAEKLMATFTESGCCVDLLKCLAASSVAAVADEDASGPNQQLIFGAMVLADSSATGRAGLDTSTARRLVKEAMDSVAKHAVALAAQLKAEAEAEAESEDEDGSEEEEDDDGSEEEEEGSDEEEDDEESGDDEEEDDDDGFDADEDSEFFQHGDAADSDDGEEIDPAFGFQELVEDDAEEDAAAEFFAWFQAADTSTMKRATTSMVKKHLASQE